MQNGIGSRREVRTSLPKPGKEIEESLPVLVHHKHLVRCVAVKKKALAK
jgi:hypothetical protein